MLPFLWIELITFQGDQESFDICPYEVIVCEQVLVGNSAMKKYVSKQFCIILGINPVIKGLCFMWVIIGCYNSMLIFITMCIDVMIIDGYRADFLKHINFVKKNSICC